MAKRFTDTDKWKKDWFINLTPTEKAFWLYLCDSCSVAGIWNVSWKAAEFHVGAKLNRQGIESTFAKQFVPLDGGKRWFIIDFVTFQYKHLNPNNLAHKGAIEELQRYFLLDVDYSILLPNKRLRGAPKPLRSSTDAPKDKAKDKSTAKAKALVTDKDIPEVFK